MKKENNEKIEVETLLKDSNVSIEVIEKITSMIEKNQHNPVEQTEDVIASIKIKIMEERDWRKRVALSAILISKSLE